MSEQPISLREFARRLGIGEKTIRDCILKGKLKECVTIVEGKPKIIYSKGIEESKKTGVGNKVISVANPVQKSKPVKPDEDISNDSDQEANLSYASALQEKENWNAKIKKLEYFEKNETLVSKSDVYTQLFEFGREIRSEFESLPGRISSKVVTLSTDVSEVEKYLATEIRNSLCKLFDNLSGRKIN